MNTKTNANTSPMAVAFLTDTKQGETEQRFMIDGKPYYLHKTLPICCEAHAENFQKFYVKTIHKMGGHVFQNVKNEKVLLGIAWFDQDNEISKMRTLRFADLAKELPQ